MKELLKQVGLLIAGGLVFSALFIIGLLYTTGKHFYKLDYSISKQFAPIVRSITLLFDGLANAGAGELLNDVFKIAGLIKFGKWYQTISAVTGLLFIYVKEIPLFGFLNKTLGSGHCVKAITEADLLYYNAKDKAFKK